MCGRFLLTTAGKRLADHFGVPGLATLPPHVAYAFPMPDRGTFEGRRRVLAGERSAV
jgi:hypothetical protein